MYGNILNKLGLSEKEAKIYEAALELGPETIQRITRKAGIKRTAAYTYVRSLIRKGLMSSGIRDKKTYFSAEAPENLSMLLDIRKKETKQLASDLQKVIPKLRTLFETTEERPRVRFFEGKEGLKTMINDFMKSKFTSAEEFVSIDEAFAFFPPQPNDYREKIRKKFRKIPMRILYSSKKGPFLKPKQKSQEYRFLLKEKFPFTGGVTIYGNKVSLISRKRTVVGVIIESKGIADTLRTMFDLAWDTAAKYNKK